jgi:hypothetical protein
MATAPIVVTSVVPTSGPSSGTTLVVVRGTGFLNSDQLYCSFGTQTLQVATWTSTTELRCRAPAEVAGTVSVEVTNNNQDYSSSAVEYLYQGMWTGEGGRMFSF